MAVRTDPTDRVLSDFHARAKSVFARSTSAKRQYEYAEHLCKSASESAHYPKERYITDTVLSLCHRAILQIEPSEHEELLEPYSRSYSWLDDEFSSLSPLVEQYATDSPDQAGVLLNSLIPTSWRKIAGEHYTPPLLVDFIISKTISASTEYTLDPAVGSGAFALGWLRHIEKHSPNKPASFCGVDTSPFAIVNAGLNIYAYMRHRPKLSKVNVSLRCGDSLCLDSGASLDSLPLFHASSGGYYDSIVGNPPYVRVQNIQPPDLRDKYRRIFPHTATGRFDLYMLFIEIACRLLKPEGRLGYIVSNKILTSNAGRGVRSYMLDHLDIQHLLDLGDSKLFQAAVLPLILIARKSDRRDKSFLFTLVRESKSEQKRAHITSARALDRITSEATAEPVPSRVHGDNGVSLVAFDTMVASRPAPGGSPWFFQKVGPSKEAISSMSASTTSLDQLCTVISAGIKSCADSVFSVPITKDFIASRRFEPACIKPYIQGANIDKWRISWTGSHAKSDTYLLYPHRELSSRTRPVPLSEIPNIASWFNEPDNHSKLTSRTYVIQAGRLWYEIWVPQRPSYFQAAYKIVCPDFATHNKFAIDHSGRWCGGTAFMMIPSDQSREWVYFLLGVLNSRAVEYFHKNAASTFIYAGRYRYTASSLGRYPIPDAASPAVRERIAALAESLEADPLNEFAANELEIAVSDAFRLSSEQRRLILSSLKAA